MIRGRAARGSFEQLFGPEAPGYEAGQIMQMEADHYWRERYQRQEFLDEERPVVRRRISAREAEKMRAVAVYLRSSGLRPGCVLDIDGHPAIVIKTLPGLRFSIRYLQTLAFIDRQVMYWEDAAKEYRPALTIAFVPPKSHTHPWLVTERGGACRKDDRLRAFVADRLAPAARLTTKWGEFWNVAEVEALREAFAAR